MLVMVPEPFALDFSRNKIYNIDFPGQSSLDGNMPFFQGHEPLKAYLLKHKISYVAFVDFNNTWGPYSRQDQLRLYPTSSARIQYQMKYLFNMMDNLEDLSKNETVIYNKDNLKIIELNS